ncbi:uncharacterized protein LOC128958501 [Oppia nitens]|uniref:uncharacterized protein LOC128958501 n=1 Tax=Oppia nitens TaxID=1686743 RepID=UPI0023DC9223|nr:uncharacterized protein LOC128958501 [Oppia nitens]
MSDPRSDSSEDISIYETPVTSPVNESLIDSSLFDSQSVDLLDSLRASAATDSTIRPSLYNLYSNTLNESSMWQTRQMVTSNDRLDTNRLTGYQLLMRYLMELENDHLEVIGIEQQMQTLSLKCRTIRENMTTKTNSIKTIITEMSYKPKQTTQKQTQTEDISDYEISLQNCLSNNKTIDTKPIISVISSASERKIRVKSDSQSESQLSSIQSLRGLSERTKQSLHRLPALVKGYLTRRLMKTEKVLQIIETIKETTQLLTTYRNLSTNRKITAEDISLHKRLIIQLENSCHDFYDIFFNYPKSAQMALISQSRQHILDRHFRMSSVLSNSTNKSQQSFRVSSVTKKVLERKTKKMKTDSISSKSSSAHK